MSQLSRPYQIGLCAVLLLGLVWMVALRGHASNPNQPAPTSAPRTAPTSAPTSTSTVAVTQAKAPSTSAAAEAKAAAAPTPVYHGAAPGVEGLTRAIAKAHGAVALSQRKAAQLQSESAQPSSEASAGSSVVTTHKSSTVVVSHGPTTVVRSTHVTVSPVKAQSPAKAQPQAPAKTPSDRQPQQVAVEHEVAQGKTVILMFWNPHSSVDVTVRKQVNVLAHRSKGQIAVHTSLSGQVGAYGSITEVAHVYQTPTILIVNHHGVVSTLTGLTDVFALEQAVSEAKAASAS